MLGYMQKLFSASSDAYKPQNPKYVRIRNAFFYLSIFFSLIFVDNLLGNGLTEIFRKCFCTVACYIKRKVTKELAEQPEIIEPPPSVGIFIAELILLTASMIFLQKYKQNSRPDRLDDLLKHSNNVLRQATDYLDTFHQRRLPKHNVNAETGPNYLDEEPADLKPLELEVPILHMAIIDTLGNGRNQPERGDAGDTQNQMDSTLLSVTSLLDDDDSMIEIENDSETPSVDNTRIDRLDDLTPISLRDRYLWDVAEETPELFDGSNSNLIN